MADTTDRILERLTDTADRFERTMRRNQKRFRGSSNAFADDARDFLEREWKDLRGDLAELSQHADLMDRSDVRALVSRIRGAMSDAGDNVTEAVTDAAQRAQTHARRGAAYVDGAVHDSPWRSVGVAVLAGLAIGMLINGNRR